MTRTEIVDVRYVAKVLFLCLASLTFGNTFDCLWIGILFALYFLTLGVLNASSRREFSKRPPYRKLPAYLAIVPLALYWVITPGVQNGVNPVMVFLPGLYFLFLATLQERSRGNGGYEAFVNFDGLLALLCSAFQPPHGTFIAVLVGIFLILFSGSRRGTIFYKYILFALVMVLLGACTYGGWQYWRAHRSYNAEWAVDYEQRHQVLGFDPAVALGSFDDNYNSKYNSQVVLRVWDKKPPKYMVGTRYASYAGGVWKLPRTPVKVLTPNYYQVDYPVMELVDSVTRHDAERVWVQSSIDNFGYMFTPYGAVGFSAKDIDSLNYFSGGMVSGLNQNGYRSDWNYFICRKKECPVPAELSNPDSSDLQILPLYNDFLDSVVHEMDLRGNLGDLMKIHDFFATHFQYSLQVPEILKKRISDPRIDPLTLFWKGRRGYCEYFASLSVLALRRVGIPARYVSGFARPEVTPGASYGIFRRKNAHAWAEVYVDSSWYVFDPTPNSDVLSISEPSFLASLWDGIQARFAKWSHALKEGTWRESLDSWQAYLEKVSDSPVTYVILALLVLALVSRRLYVAHLKKLKNISANTLKAKAWAKKLTQAEYQLSRVELRRESGETVGHFLARIKKQPLEGKAALARKTLEDYEGNRWT